MQCKWIKVEGVTTKYLRCSLKDKTIDEYECRNCPMFVKDNNVNDIVNQLFGMFNGGNYGK